MDQDPRKEIEEEAGERREEEPVAEVDDAGEAASEGLIGPDQPGGAPPQPTVGEGGPDNPPGPAKADPSLPAQERDPSLVAPQAGCDDDEERRGSGAIPASDLPAAERARLAHEADGPQIPERDRPVLRPRKDDKED